MVKEAIQIYLRFRPPTRKISKYDIEDDGLEKPRVIFQTNRLTNSPTVHNRMEAHRFHFDAIFNVEHGQDEVFDAVSKPVIDQVLSGYNGTIFAYGQTGSGKTYTITGGAEKYSDRGIIPRSIAYIFSHFDRHLETEYTMKISYLEIYNENGYDLLDAQHESAAKLEEMPRVSLYEDTEAGTVHLKNLSIHPATSVDEALNLLFMGDTNRIIAETPMNEASTRSHCIFTIHIMARSGNCSKVRRSKLHLVDLAGSERAHKSGIDGTTLTEAKYINLSLHYLEQVIVALSDKQRTHVPYRNSMMTMVLRDSLGGNCLTSMIATCSLEQRNLPETISTCRFAQRVALIKNVAVLNEELDSHVIIIRLKQEVERLKADLALATGVERTEDLTEEQKERCAVWVQRFLACESPNSEEISSQMFSDIRNIYFCFQLIQRLYRELQEKNVQSVQSVALPAVPLLPVDTKEAEELRSIVAQRDHEIRILVDLLRKEKSKRTVNNRLSPIKDTKTSKAEETMPRSNPLSDTVKVADHVTNWLEQHAKGRLLGTISSARAEAFELFKRDYHLRGKIERQKDELKLLYAEAKTLGKRMFKARDEAGHLQEQLKSQLLLNGSDSDRQSPLNSDALRAQLELKRKEYTDTYCQLKNLKPEIEHLQHVLENAKVKFVQDFQEWWSNGCSASSPNCKDEYPTSESGELFAENEKRDVKFHLHESNQTSGTEETIKISDDAVCSTREESKQFTTTSTRGMNLADGHVIPLTGDAVVDADILTFVRARDRIRHRQLEQQRLNVESDQLVNK
ncbi:kinesin protein KIF6 [Fasciola hepatica]|uniref:Kinesin-like protein n=1 Tax=Fasciola hepatica TaxID=6192 RepID=A0A4E0S2Y8_FASHE|nr:kinesin protein KIF6 [Fasciola hepatica]